uniref:RING-type domain-containing protein n=1 Tax=Haptolina ericina TaxID=156174 RepID=A0A7S3BCN2_9EUKA
MHFLNSTARSSRSPEPAQQPHIPDQAMEHMPDFPRSIGVVPPRNFNTRDRHAAFEVELVKFGALVTAFLPAVLEVGADGILLRQMSDGQPPIRAFSWKMLYGWLATDTGFRLQTDVVGTYIDMRTPGGRAMTDALNKYAQQHLSHLVFRDGGAMLPPPRALDAETPRGGAPPADVGLRTSSAAEAKKEAPLPKTPVAPPEGNKPPEPGANDAMCVICLERPLEFAFMPCGHFCVCAYHTHPVGGLCPVCRTEVHGVSRIFA